MLVSRLNQTPSRCHQMSESIVSVLSAKLQIKILIAKKQE